MEMKMEQKRRKERQERVLKMKQEWRFKKE